MWTNQCFGCLVPDGAKVGSTCAQPSLRIPRSFHHITSLVTGRLAPYIWASRLNPPPICSQRVLARLRTKYPNIAEHGDVFQFGMFDRMRPREIRGFDERHVKQFVLSLLSLGPLLVLLLPVSDGADGLAETSRPVANRRTSMAPV